jgi:WD40 repeat protein
MNLPNPNYILISTLNNQMQVIDLLSEDEVIKYTGHTNSRYLVDIVLFEESRSGKKYLISGSEDQCIAFWDVEKGGDCAKYNIGGMRDDKHIVNCVSVNNKNILAYSSFPDSSNSISLLSLNMS